MNDREETITELEEEFPKLAGTAFMQARKEALDAGFSVWESDGDVIYEVFPDGRRIERKRIEPPTPVEPGAKFVLREE